MDNIPPAFCWKKTLDVGTVPSECPENYKLYGVECRENCRSGYTYKWPSCWESCPSGYADMGLWCQKWFKSVDKHSYIPDYGLSAVIGTCPAGKYMSGALCYESCSAMTGTMVNCGTAGCARTTQTCVEELSEMTYDIGTGIADLVGFVVSFGASGSTKLFSMKSALTESIETIGVNAAIAVASAAKGYLSNSSVRSSAISDSYSYIVNDLGYSVSFAEYQTFCSSIIDGVKTHSSMPIE